MCSHNVEHQIPRSPGSSVCTAHRALQLSQWLRGGWANWGRGWHWGACVQSPLSHLLSRLNAQKGSHCFCGSWLRSFLGGIGNTRADTPRVVETGKIFRPGMRGLAHALGPVSSETRIRGNARRNFLFIFLPQSFFLFLLLLSPAALSSVRLLRVFVPR